MSVTTGLKPPPRFVTNMWAWSYTLNKLAERGGLDEDGNPSNYGAAIAIYKRVARKYGNPDAPKVVGEPFDTDLLIGFKPHWVVAHGAALAATDQLDARVWKFDQAWYVEVYLSRGQFTSVLTRDAVLELLARSPAAVAWAESQ